MRDKNQDTQQAILNTAKQVFIDNGYAGTQMQAIADQAEVNKALIHYYFSSKQKLFEQVLKDLLQTLMLPLLDILEKPAPAKEKLKAFVNSYSDTLNANPHLPLFMLQQLSTNNTMIVSFFKSEIKTKLESFINEIRSDIGAGAKNLDPRQLFMNFTSMLAFPFVAKDIFKTLFNLSETEYTALIDERKTMLCQMIEDKIPTNSGDTP
jgi:TetR/AcrR family transcriptional regulator